jgi:SNF2 family DNA or RNA helicase
MGFYELNINKELLSLGAVEFNNSFKSALKKLKTNNNVIFINEKNEKKNLNINFSENLLEGRGIKKFFENSKYQKAFAEVLDSENIKISFYKKDNSDLKNNVDISPDNLKRVEKFTYLMMNNIQNSEKFFNIYHQSRDFTNSSELGELISIPYLRDINIFNYQVKTVQEVLTKFKGRVILSDEVGLGKTIEACMAMSEYIMRGLAKKILILVPPSLVDQWYYELKRKFNQDFIRNDDNDFKNKENPWEEYNKVIASISSAKRKNNSNLISKIHYDLIIVDEAHHLKNRKTVAWNFVNNLNKKFIYLLTATPVQNNLEELYNLITLLKPGQLKTYSYFKKNFIGSQSGIEVKNPEKLRELISSVMIRNKRSDIDIQFTKRYASTDLIELTESEKYLYDGISKFIKERYKDKSSSISRFLLKCLQEEMGSSFLTLNNTLKKLVENDKVSSFDKNTLKEFHILSKEIINEDIPPKLISLLEIIKNFNDKMIIFTKYRTTQSSITDFLTKQGLIVAEFHGGLKRADKEKQIDLFREKAQIIVSTETGGEGRNLQFCNGLINYDLPWNPMSIEQRIGRIHRVGQERDVYVFNLASKNTIEHYILDLLDKKINMFELVIGEVDMILGDIEEKESFSDIIMNAWTSSLDDNIVRKEMDIIGEKLLKNKNQYKDIKGLDEKIFSSILNDKK